MPLTLFSLVSLAFVLQLHEKNQQFSPTTRLCLPGTQIEKISAEYNFCCSEKKGKHNIFLIIDSPYFSFWGLPLHTHSSTLSSSRLDSLSLSLKKLLFKFIVDSCLAMTLNSILVSERKFVNGFQGWPDQQNKPAKNIIC